MTKLIYTYLLCLLLSCQTTLTKENLDEFTYKNNRLYDKNVLYSGILIEHYKNGQLAIQQTYHKGRLNGISKKWYADGVLSEVRHYEDGNKINTHKGWWPNGQQKFEYTFNKTGVLHGELKEWYSNGVLFKSFHFNNGHEEGSQQMWTENGVFRANYVIVNGEKFGLIGSKLCKSN